MLELYPFLVERIRGNVGARIVGGFFFGVQTLFVHLPYAIFLFLVEFLSLFLRVIEMPIDDMRESIFGASQTIFSTFTRTTTVGVGSLFGAVLIFVVIRLTYLFFFGDGGFGKELIRVLVLVIFMFAWFGTVTIGGVRMSGGLAFVRTIDTVTDFVVEGMVFSLGEDDAVTGDNMSDILASQVVRPIFNFINSGSYSGCYVFGGSDEGGGCLDMSEIRSSDQQRYVDRIASNNPFVRLNFLRVIPSFVAVVIGIVDLIFTTVMLAFAQLIRVGSGLLSVALFAVVPVAVMASFVPAFADFVFNVVKKMVGLLFVPAFVIFLMTVLFFINQQIDIIIMGRVHVLDLGPITPSLEVGMRAISLVLRIILLYFLWVYRNSLLSLLSNGKVNSFGATKLGVGGKKKAKQKEVQQQAQNQQEQEFGEKATDKLELDTFSEAEQEAVMEAGEIAYESDREAEMEKAGKERHKQDGIMFESVEARYDQEIEDASYGGMIMTMPHYGKPIKTGLERRKDDQDPEGLETQQIALENSSTEQNQNNDITHDTRSDVNSNVEVETRGESQGIQNFEVETRNDNQGIQNFELETRNESQGMRNFEVETRNESQGMQNFEPKQESLEMDVRDVLNQEYHQGEAERNDFLNYLRENGLDY